MIELVGTPTFPAYHMLREKIVARPKSALMSLSSNELQWLLENLRKAEVFWATVEPIQVDLSDWRTTEDVEGNEICGTLACFGGHLAHSKMLGIEHEGEDFAPFLTCAISPNQITHKFNHLYASEVSYWLFGGDLFNSRVVNENGTDYEIVASRISHQIDVLEMYLNKQMLAHGA